MWKGKGAEHKVVNGGKKKEMVASQGEHSGNVDL